MNISSKVKTWTTILAVLAVAGATMTMPNPELQSLAGQISQEGESPMVARIGRVVNIVEADNITVAISGASTLVRASYAFPAYQPLLGDLVYVSKQDAQWFVIGTMSGSINSLLSNPSYENGTVGAVPTDWSITTVSSTAGVISFTKDSLGAVAGNFIGVIRNSSAGVAGTSSSDIFSSSVIGTPGSRWALGYFITYAVPDVNASLVPQGGFMDLQAFIQFLDPDGVLISQTSANYTPIYSSVIAPVYQRTFTPTGDVAIVAPLNTGLVRVRIRVNMTMHVNSASEIGLDVFMLRTA